MPDLEKSGAHRQVTAASRFGLSPSSSDPLSTHTNTDTLVYGSSPISDISSSSSSSLSSVSDDESDNDDDEYSLSSAPSSISPPPAYHATYPPSPPSSVLSAGGKSYINPLHKALSSPSKALKPSLTSRSSSSSSTSSFEEDAVPQKSLLDQVFPTSSSIHQLPSTPITLSSLPRLSSGMIVENASTGTRTLFVLSPSSSLLTKRETICELLEVAEESGCTGLMVALEKKMDGLGELLHSLMYVGGTVGKGWGERKNWVLVGLDV